VDVTFDIQAGEPYTIARIEVSGNDPTFDKVVRREIPLMEGERYSSTALREARARLQRLGFFEEIRIATPRGEEEGTLEMEVNVVEQPTGSFSAQAGFSSLDNFTIGFSMAKNNFLGMGVGMNAAVNLSANQQQGNLSFSDPHFLDSRWTLSSGAYTQYTSYNEEEYRHGGSLSLGRYLDPREDLSLSLRYGYEDSGVLSVDAYKQGLLGGQLYRSGATSGLGLTLSVDKRNNRMRPSEGWYLNLSSELSGGLRVGDDQVLDLLGGDFRLLESKLNLRLFQPIIPDSERLVLRFNSTLGHIVSTDGSIVPYIHRYRAGGMNSVRGYDNYSLGPSLRVAGYSSSSSTYGSTTYGSDDPTAAEDKLVVGGTELWVNNLELEFNLVPGAGISAVTFLDAGNAFGDPWSQGHIDPLALRASYGFGVRWVSPMGPLRFEWGLPFEPQPGERNIVFDFSMGTFF
jgi:outer membrane protein insertion porin family